MASNGIEGAATMPTNCPMNTPRPSLNPTLARHIKDPFLIIQISAIVFSFIISLSLVPGFHSIIFVKSKQRLFPSSHRGTFLGQQLLAYILVLNYPLMLLTIQSFVGMWVTVRLISKWRKKLVEEEEQRQEPELQAGRTSGNHLLNLDEWEDSFFRDVQIVRYGALGASFMALICLFLTITSMCWVSTEASLFPSASPSLLELKESSHMTLGNRLETLLLVVVVILLVFLNGSFPAFTFLSKCVKERGRVHPQFQV